MTENGSRYVTWPHLIIMTLTFAGIVVTVILTLHGSAVKAADKADDNSKGRFEQNRTTIIKNFESQEEWNKENMRAHQLIMSDLAAIKTKLEIRTR